MREIRREQQLIGLCTLLDDTGLGERRETIMHLVHSARRASHAREAGEATGLCLSALKQLRRARHSLRVAGAGADALSPLDAAIAGLQSVCDEAMAQAMEAAVLRLFGRMALLSVLLPAGVTAVLFGAGVLIHILCGTLTF